MSDDLLERIDSLIDDQLEAGEPERGYNYGDPQFPRCWHCGRHWHGLPVTQKIAEMYSWGTYEEEYRVAGDDSPVLCPGSEFIGPMRSAGMSPMSLKRIRSHTVHTTPVGNLWVDFTVVTELHALWILDHWDQFLADPFPVPKAPGYDFTGYSVGDNSYPTSEYLRRTLGRTR